MTPQDASPEPRPEPWQEEDFTRCFWLAVQDAKERIQRGEPIPRWLRSKRDSCDE